MANQATRLEKESLLARIAPGKSTSPPKRTRKVGQKRTRKVGQKRMCGRKTFW